MAISFSPTTVLTYVVSQTIAGNFNAPAVSKEFFDGMYVQAVVTGGGSPTGSFKIQSSSDAVSWADVTGTTQAVSGPGVVSWNVSQAKYKFFRLVYTFTSGTGTLNASYNLS